LNASFGGDLVAAETTRLSEAENARDKIRKIRAKRAIAMH